MNDIDDTRSIDKAESNAVQPTRSALDIIVRAAFHHSKCRQKSENRAEHGDRVIPKATPHGPCLDYITGNLIRGGEVLMLSLSNGGGQAGVAETALVLTQ